MKQNRRTDSRNRRIECRNRFTASEISGEYIMARGYLVIISNIIIEMEIDFNKPEKSFNLNVTPWPDFAPLLIV